MAKKAVTLRFDDALASHWSEARPRMTDYGFPGVLAVPTSQVDKLGHLTLADLKILQSFGWDICSHSMTHPHMSGLTSEKMDEELEGSKEWLQKRGFRKGARFFITPYLERNEILDAEIRKYYIPTDKLPHLAVTKDMTADTIWDRIEASDTWLALIFHDLVSTVAGATWQYPLAEFQRILDHIHDERLRVVTFSDKVGELEKQYCSL